MSDASEEVESMHESNRCPRCLADLTGDPIPEEYREEHYGGKTHFSRIIGVYSREQDRTVAWRCPDCGYEEARR